MSKTKINSSVGDGIDIFGADRDTSFLRAMAVYLVFSLTTIVALVLWVNSLVTEHDKRLTGEICSLITEKMNNSIYYMTDSAENIAAMLSEERHEDLGELYEGFSPQNYSDSTRRTFLSIGFIDAEGKLYANEAEEKEFGKWELLETAEQADPVSISAPYRSGMTGQPVFTLFAKMNYGSSRTGKLFITYPLSEIQEMAATKSLADETEIWLLNAPSGNVIRCAGRSEHEIGSWANALILMKEIDPGDRESYESWSALIKNDCESAVMSYHSGGKAYTQVGSKINFMDGWYVVVRIPSSSLSNTLQRFRSVVIVFLGVLFLASLLIFMIAHKRSAQEKQILRNLSIHDALTGVMNRRAFDFLAAHRLQKTRSDMTLLFFDVDYFKQVNDYYGHESGDKILREFASALGELFGRNGLVSRYGGDEFVVLTDISDKAELTAKLDRLKTMTSQIQPAVEITGDMEELHLSYSAGAAVFPADGGDLKELEASADAALYEVKKNGRNSYGWYSGSGVPKDISDQTQS